MLSQVSLLLILREEGIKIASVVSSRYVPVTITDAIQRIDDKIYRTEEDVRNIYTDLDEKINKYQQRESKLRRKYVWTHPRSRRR